MQKELKEQLLNHMSNVINYDYFMVLTLKNEDDGINYLAAWLSRVCKTSEANYIISTEHFSNGGFYFELLLSGVPAEALGLNDTGERTVQNKIIYNIDSWTYGYAYALFCQGEAK